MKVTTGASAFLYEQSSRSERGVGTFVVGFFIRKFISRSGRDSVRLGGGERLRARDVPVAFAVRRRTITNTSIRVF